MLTKWSNFSADSVYRRPLQRERNRSESKDERDDSGISSRTGSHSDWSASPAMPRTTRHGSVIEIEQGTPSESQIRKTLIIDALKKEVKVVMEEAATRKYVDINSVYVTSLCLAVERCVMDGLRKRFLGLLGQRTSLALLHTVAKGFPPAEAVLEKTAQITSDSRGNVSSTTGSSQVCWIRESLHMRLLSSILNFIAISKDKQRDDSRTIWGIVLFCRMRRVYDEDALMMDRAKGGMPAALLLGPCAISFKRMSEGAHDPPVEWHDHMKDPPSSAGINGRPPLSVKRQGSSLVSLERSSTSRDYVFSLHANYRTTLLYGKNNVSTAPDFDNEENKGYLSMHKNIIGDLTLRWTPNQLMHACSQPSSAASKDSTTFTWKQALYIELNQIIYIHLHQTEDDSPSCITFVNCEGGQSPPLYFSAGQQSLLFMDALESGLAPLYRLDPPLTQDKNKDKTLPNLRRKTSMTATSQNNHRQDYVFRIHRLNTQLINMESASIAEDNSTKVPCSPSTNGYKSVPNSPAIMSNVDSLVNVHVGLACRSMQQQILARAFFGWLSYCRHLKTLRKHLVGLFHNDVVLNADKIYKPVDEAFWERCRQLKTPELKDEFFRRIYYEGIEEPEVKRIRRQAWPYLIGLFEWDEPVEPKTTHFTEKYRQDVEEWRTLEAEVRRRDEEAFNAARARKGATPIRELSMASDVFDDEEENEDVKEDKKKAKERELLIDCFGTNLHRIEKDVERCDRALRFFSNPQNLESLRRVVCTYVRRNLEDGYVQGMCDIAAPLLVVFEDEALTLECYSLLMNRMKENFPHHSGMDRCLSNLRSLVQVIDPDIFSMLSGSADFTQLYFSYRWFLLDFKRELSYDGVFRLWETIWACSRFISNHFPLFFAMAMLTNYRDAIIENDMDFADLIKFFNDMTSRHDVGRLLSAARTHLRALHLILENVHS